MKPELETAIVTLKQAEAVLEIANLKFEAACCNNGPEDWEKKEVIRL